jgi:uncharacterized cupin superfamily protein
MQTIEVITTPSTRQLDDLKVHDWAIWTHEPAEFPWVYNETEVCYFLSGNVTVIPDEGEGAAIEMGKGHLVTFPKGLACRWIIHEAVRKHYQFS